MPLKLVKRPGSALFYIRGTVAGRSTYETTGTQNKTLAEEFRAKRETQLYEERRLGKNPSVPFITAAEAFLEFDDRGVTTEAATEKLADYFDLTPLRGIAQAEADAAVHALYPRAAPATRVRLVYTPLTSILNFGAARKWCDAPRLIKPKMPKGKTAWLTPDQAMALAAAAAPHLKPLLTFILCTGARLAEAIELQWADVNLAAAQAIFRDTKNGHGRIAALPPAAILALANIAFPDPKNPVREGPVFLTDTGEPYADRNRTAGGQIKTAFAGAIRRANLPDSFTPHDLRHTWATWFYAVTKDLLLLKDEGGWRTLAMVERYAHLMPSEQAGQVHKVWGATHPRIGVLPGAEPARKAKRRSAG